MTLTRCKRIHRMRAAWIVAVLAALAVAAHATELEDKVAKTIDEFKAMMPTGRADLNIPVLEPVSIKNLPLNIDASPLNAKVVASGVQVAGASSFQLTQLSQVGDSSQVDVAVEVPGVDVTGDYDINGKVKVGFLHVNLNGQGPLRISVKGIKGAGSADILSRDDGSIHLNDMKINSWSYDSLSIDLENLFDGGVMGKTVNKLINKLVPTFASANYAKLTALLESVAKKYINKYLDGVGVNGHMLTAPEAQAVDWIVTEEVQDILNQLAVAVYPDDEPYDLETTVRALSEDFRVAMKEGREDLGIAAMDPAVFSELAVHFHKWLLDGQVVASNVQVSGASDFELTKVTALDDTKVVIDYEVPAVSLTAEYALDAKVNVGVTKLHSVRNGALEMTARGIKGAATAVLGVDADGQLRLDSFQVDSWTYAGLSVRVDNQNDAGFIKKQVNTLIGKLVPSLLVKPHAKELTAWVSSRAQKVLGRFLDGAAGRIVIAGLDGRAAALLEQLRAIMQTGSEQYGMPVLDPFTLDALPISFEDKFISASVIAKDFHVAGTSAYTISEISQLPNSNEVSVVVEVPEIHGSSNFEASAALQWPKKEVTDSGSLTAQLKGLKVFATARLAENAEGSLLLRDLKITSWTYSKIQVEFANLMDSHVKILLNTAINTVLPTIVNAEKDVINSWAEVTAKAVLDQYLAGVAQAALPAVHVKVVPAEARQMIMQLAALAA